MPLPSAQAQSFGDLRIEGQGNTLTINQIVQMTASEIIRRPFNSSSPYLGLRRFEERHRELFFGRDRLVGNLLQAVAESNFLLVAGASGSGKSSLIRAGLIPQLLQRLDSARFRPFVMTPDRNPFASLRSALIAAGYDQADTDLLEEPSAAAMMRAATKLRAPGDLWLLFIDQFEQIFTRGAEEAMRAGFLDGLVALATSPQREVKVVLATRADYLDRLSAYPQLGTLAERNLRLVPAMQPEELRAVIEQPAARHGVAFEPGLVDQILAEVRGRAASLPLLEFTLDLLWREDNPADDRTLSVSTYHRIGGVEGALRVRADDLYLHGRRSRDQPRRAEEQAVIRRVFLRLADFGSSGGEGPPVSRRADRAEFHSELEQRVIDELIDEALLVSDGTTGSKGRGGTLELAHEALLTSWPLLGIWLAEGREAISLRNRLATDGARYLRVLEQEPEKAADELWSGMRLHRALELRARGDFTHLLGGLSPEEDDFLDASEALRQSRARAEEQRREELQRVEREKREQRIRLLRITGVVLTFFLALSVIAAITARKQQRQAKRETVRAEQRETDLLIENARQYLSEQRRLDALKLLVDAYERGSNHADLPILLMDAVDTHQRNVLIHPDAVISAEFSPDGTRALTACEDGKARIWDVQTGSLLMTLEGSRWPLISAHFNRDGSSVLAAGDKTAYLWDAKTGKQIHVFAGQQNSLRTVQFSKNEKYILTSSSEGTIRLWDPSSGNTFAELPTHNPQGYFAPALFDRKSSNIIAVDTSQSCCNINFIDIETRKIIATIVFPNNDGLTKIIPNNENILLTTYLGVKSIERGTMKIIRTANIKGAFADIFVSPDGQRFLSTDVDGTMGIFSNTDGTLVSRPTRHHGRISDAEFSFDSKTVVSVGSDRTAKLWDVGTGNLLATLEGHADSVSTGRFSPDGALVITAGDDKTARIWDVESALMPRHQSLSLNTERAFSLGKEVSRHVVPSYGLKGALAIRDVVTGSLYGQLPHYQRMASFSDDGKILATQGSDNTLNIWNGENGQPIKSINDSTEFKNTVKELFFTPDNDYLITNASGNSSGFRMIITISPVGELVPERVPGSAPWPAGLSWYEAASAPQRPETTAPRASASSGRWASWGALTTLPAWPDCASAPRFFHP